jgi:hypothetical protein
MPNLITIDDSNYTQYVDHIGPDGQKRAKGLCPRNFETHPQGCFAVAAPLTIPLIPESEWDDRIAEQEAKQSSLTHIRDKGSYGSPIPSYDQNGKGYCWAHGPTSAVTLVRAINNQPYVPFSAYMVACLIKNYQDQGGFGGEALSFIAKNGIASSAFWPLQSMSRSNDTPAMRGNAALNKCESWWDLSSDKTTARAQLATLLLLNVPVVVDYDWWSHCVCAVRLVKRSPFTITIWNSWGDSWSANGMGNLVESKAVPDSAVAPRVMTAAAA